MLELSSSGRVYVFTQATDMRKGFDRLSELVREHLKRSVLGGGLFVFFSRRRDRVMRALIITVHPIAIIIAHLNVVITVQLIAAIIDHVNGVIIDQLGRGLFD